jgi:hypothetical protein|tara:strand:- start:1599 stop:1775 length:177 start_codon:yes stop_codon:yes gene_type:complete
MANHYISYLDLEKKYNRNRKTIWRWWAKDGSLEPPKRAGKIFLGWTEAQLIKFENGEG